MKYIKHILLIITAFFYVSCEEVIDADLTTAPPRLVIEASIDWAKGTDGSQQTIKLTTTAGYYETVIPVVNGATVFIANTAGTLFNFTEDAGTGLYKCTDFSPQIGETYVLTVISGGQTYTATETMQAVPDFGYTTQNNEGGFFGDNIEVRFYFQDFVGQENYYLWRLDTRHSPYPVYSVESDEFTADNEIFGIASYEDMIPGDVLDVKLYGISKRYYDYMGILLSTAGGTGAGPFTSVPVSAKGNIINQASPDNFALGYFRCSEVDAIRYVVQ